MPGKIENSQAAEEQAVTPPETQTNNSQKKSGPTLKGAVHKLKKEASKRFTWSDVATELKEANDLEVATQTLEQKMAEKEAKTTAPVVREQPLPVTAEPEELKVVTPKTEQTKSDTELDEHAQVPPAIEVVTSEVEETKSDTASGHHQTEAVILGSDASSDEEEILDNKDNLGAIFSDEAPAFFDQHTVLDPDPDPHPEADTPLASHSLGDQPPSEAVKINPEFKAYSVFSLFAKTIKQRREEKDAEIQQLKIDLFGELANFPLNFKASLFTQKSQDIITEMHDEILDRIEALGKEVTEEGVRRFEFWLEGLLDTHKNTFPKDSPIWHEVKSALMTLAGLLIDLLLTLVKVIAPEVDTYSNALYGEEEVSEYKVVKEEVLKLGLGASERVRGVLNKEDHINNPIKYKKAEAARKAEEAKQAEAAEAAEEADVSVSLGMG